jgi:hypothetical protein
MASAGGSCENESGEESLSAGCHHGVMYIMKVARNINK